jgi:erythromycin esterase-like protein
MIATVRAALLIAAVLMMVFCVPNASRAATPGDTIFEKTTIDKTTIDKRESAELDRLVRDVCRKSIVLLGEDANHGGGRTFEVKTEIVKRLVSRCGFGAVLFESQLYDALDYEHAVADGTANPQQLANAIGALWARSQASQPLIGYLFRETSAGRLRLGGIDPQVGGVMGEYSKQRLAAALAAPLENARRDACTTGIGMHNGWGYDDTHPFDEAARQRLRACSDDIRAAIAGQGIDPASELATMASSYSRYLDMALEGDGNLRDLGMYENLVWHRGRWPAGTKLIVWCATVHAAKALDGLAVDMKPMGGHLRAAFGDRVAAIGFTALSGRFGNPGAGGESHPLGTLPAHALEAAVLAGSDVDLRYVDGKRLKRFGTMVARPINYRRVHAAPWADVLDGLVVLREERAIERVR